MQSKKTSVALAVVAVAGLAVTAHAGLVPISQSYQITGEASVSSKAMGKADTQGFELSNALSTEKPSLTPSVLKNGHGIAAVLESKSAQLYAWTDASAYTSAGLDNLLLESSAGGVFEGVTVKGDQARFASKSTATIEFQVTSPVAIELSGWLDAANTTKESPFGFTRWASLSLSNEKGLIHAMSSEDKGFEGMTKFADVAKLDVGTYRLDVASYVEGSEFEVLSSKDAFAGANASITVIPTPATAALALVGVVTMARRRRA
jgi:hypothetical protein